MERPQNSRPVTCRGGTLIEFTLVALMLFMVIFVVFEMDRVFLVMTALADATRVGVRYAIVHGSDNPASSSDVQQVVKNFAKSGILDPSRLNFTGPTYTPNSNPGSKVDLKVTYVYDPFVGYFPITFTLGSKSQGIITY